MPQLTGPRVDGEEPVRSTAIAISRDLDPHLDQDRLVADPVVVEVSLGLIAAVGDGRDRLAVELGGLAGDLCLRRPHRVETEAGDDRLQTLLAGAAGGDLGVHVADQRVAEPAVAAEEVDQVLARLVAGDDLGRSPADALLVDVGRVHRHAGVLAADVEPVRAGGGEADQLAVDEDRAEDRGVVEVRALQVGVVHVEDVARLVDVDAERLGGELDADLEVAHEQGHAGGLTEDVGVLVEEGDGAVEPFVDDGGVGRAEEGRVHVLGAGQEEVADDLGRNWIGGCRGRHAGFPFLLQARVRAPAASTPSVLELVYVRRFDQASTATATTMIAPLTMSW